MPLGAFHIGTAYTVLDAEITHTAFLVIAHSPLGNDRGDVLAGFDVVDVNCSHSAWAAEPSAAASEVLSANSRSRLAEGLQFIQR